MISTETLVYIHTMLSSDNLTLTGRLSVQNAVVLQELENALKERQQQEDNIVEYPQGKKSGEAAETSGSDSVEQSGKK